MLGGLIPRRRGISKRSHIRAVGRDLVLAASQIGLTITMLPHQAWDPGRSTVRMEMGTGLWDTTGGHYLVPGPVASATQLSAPP